jgi:hypothetical protein
VRRRPDERSRHRGDTRDGDRRLEPGEGGVEGVAPEPDLHAIGLERHGPWWRALPRGADTEHFVDGRPVGPGDPGVVAHGELGPGPVHHLCGVEGLELTPERSHARGDEIPRAVAEEMCGGGEPRIVDAHVAIR